ncbi:FolC bifunctional family protein [Desulfovibrionales bacterium]
MSHTFPIALRRNTWHNSYRIEIVIVPIDNKITTKITVPIFPTFTAWNAWLDDLGLFQIDLGLSRISAALDTLELRRSTPASVQVVGTNGKGSTAAFLDALGRAHGRRTGLFTSPHLISVRERIQVNGCRVSETAWLKLVERCHSTALALSLTYFEYLTLLAAAAFAGHDVELAIWESGLGGRWDATTALARDLVCITPIDLDHQAVLGDSVAAIAWDKIGALTNGSVIVPGIAGPQSTEIAALIAVAAANGTTLQEATAIVELETLDPGSTVTGFIPGPAAPPGFPTAVRPRRLGLAGPHQWHNSQLALASFSNLATAHGWPLSAAACAAGLETAFIPGRLQIVPGRPAAFPDLILDGGHNPHGLTALAAALATEGLRPAAVIFTCLQDKPLEWLASLIAGLTPGPILVPELTRLPRARPAATVAKACGDRGLPVTDMATALQATLDLTQKINAEAGKRPNPVLLCGSLFLLAEFFRIYPDLLEPPTGKNNALPKNDCITAKLT